MNPDEHPKNASVRLIHRFQLLYIVQSGFSNLSCSCLARKNTRSRNNQTQHQEGKNG
jgi:hypothetical protein